MKYLVKGYCDAFKGRIYIDKTADWKDYDLKTVEIVNMNKLREDNPELEKLIRQYLCKEEVKNGNKKE